MLYQHQRTGAKWIEARGRAYLGDDVGLGKTYTVAAALPDFWGTLGSTLVVCPAIVRTHWRRVAEEVLGHAHTVVKSYDEIVRGGYPLMRELLEAGIDTLVLDEAHYLKHTTSKRSQLLLGVNGYARRMGRVIAASGTPVPKNPAEFWPILYGMFPDVCAEHGLHTREDYLERFCIVRPRYVRGRLEEKIMPVIVNPVEFQEILNRVMLRRTRDEVGLDVPALDWQILRLDASERFYDGGWEIERSLDDLESIANDPHIARLRRRLGEFKAPLVAKMLYEQLEDSDEKVVVFAHHRSVLRQLHEALEEYGVAYVDGDTTPPRRDLAIDSFQNWDARVFLGQTIACQTGITLTAARRVVLVEPDWTAIVNHQAGHRVARIGQTASHCVAQLVCLAGTIDEAIVTQNRKEVLMHQRANLA